MARPAAFDADTRLKELEEQLERSFAKIGMTRPEVSSDFIDRVNTLSIEELRAENAESIARVHELVEVFRRAFKHATQTADAQTTDGDQPSNPSITVAGLSSEDAQAKIELFRLAKAAYNAAGALWDDILYDFLLSKSYVHIKSWASLLELHKAAGTLDTDELFRKAFHSRTDRECSVYVRIFTLVSQFSTPLNTFLGDIGNSFRGWRPRLKSVANNMTKRQMYVGTAGLTSTCDRRNKQDLSKARVALESANGKPQNCVKKNLVESFVQFCYVWGMSTLTKAQRYALRVNSHMRAKHCCIASIPYEYDGLVRFLVEDFFIWAIGTVNILDITNNASNIPVMEPALHRLFEDAPNVWSQVAQVADSPPKFASSFRNRNIMASICTAVTKMPEMPADAGMTDIWPENPSNFARAKGVPESSPEAQAAFLKACEDNTGILFWSAPAYIEGRRVLEALGSNVDLTHMPKANMRDAIGMFGCFTLNGKVKAFSVSAHWGCVLSHGCGGKAATKSGLKWALRNIIRSMTYVYLLTATIKSYEDKDLASIAPGCI